MDEDLVLALGGDDRVLHVVPRDRLPKHFKAGRPTVTHGRATSVPTAPVLTATTGRRPRVDVHDLELHHAVFSGAGVEVVAWQYYDQTGRELFPGPTGEFARGPGPAVPEEQLLIRMSRALGYLQAILDTSTVPEIERDRRIGRRVPRPTGTLAEVLPTLPGLFGFFPGDQIPNDGGWLHRLAHAAGLAHR